EVKTPFYYEPYESWDILARYTNTLGLIMILLLTIPVSGIFTDEFQTGAEATFSLGGLYGNADGSEDSEECGGNLCAFFSICGIAFYRQRNAV
ncbi:MAG: hypothetical protein Q4A29_10625, partial [Eubacteriales bacterium]|nr:hypothetical protein [Eubacteriales bacterium]